jgi:hypothetical protein
VNLYDFTLTHPKAKHLHLNLQKDEREVLHMYIYMEGMF